MKLGTLRQASFLGKKLWIFMFFHFQLLETHLLQNFFL